MLMAEDPIDALCRSAFECDIPEVIGRRDLIHQCAETV